jgi:hypothetical protein
VNLTARLIRERINHLANARTDLEKRIEYTERQFFAVLDNVSELTWSDLWDLNRVRTRTIERHLRSLNYQVLALDYWAKGRISENAWFRTQFANLTGVSTNEHDAAVKLFLDVFAVCGDCYTPELSQSGMAYQNKSEPILQNCMAVAAKAQQSVAEENRFYSDVQISGSLVEGYLAMLNQNNGELSYAELKVLWSSLIKDLTQIRQSRHNLERERLLVQAQINLLKQHEMDLIEGDNKSLLVALNSH